MDGHRNAMGNNRFKKPWLAGLLSFLYLGLGQFYCGRPKRGILLAAVFFSFQIPLWLLFFIPLAKVNFVLPSAVFCFFYYFVIHDAVKLARKVNLSQETQPFSKWYFYVLFIGISYFAQVNLSATTKGSFVQAFKIPTESMAPSFVIGDRIVVEKWFSEREGVSRGDVIVFPYPGDETRAFIKRVVGLPGEKLEIKKQQVFINGQAIDESYAFHSEPARDERVCPRDDLDQIVIPEGFLFVMGDNRERSKDSRYFGLIEVSKVMGKAKMFYWSYDKKESQVRWNRIGELVS